MNDAEKQKTKDLQKQAPEGEAEQYLPKFVKPEFILDGMKRRPDDPEYDGTTLYIPGYEWRNFSPCMNQFWDLK